jgi:SAM-dependent methyltransferase
MRGAATMRDERVIWHDAECGSYDADLPLWLELAAAQPGPVLELGCGTGRVAIALARAGHAVTAIDLDEALIGALVERARGLDLDARVDDARRLEVAGSFGLVAAPMQMLQLLAGPAERERALASAREHLAPGGMVAAAIVDDMPGEDGEAEPLPDVAEIDGWVYSSLPLEVVHRGDFILVTRLRQIVSPAGELTEEVDETLLAVVTAADLEAEAQAAGLRPAGRRDIPTTALHVGSTVVLLAGE